MSYVFIPISAWFTRRSQSITQEYHDCNYLGVSPMQTPSTLSDRKRTFFLSFTDLGVHRITKKLSTVLETDGSPSQEVAT